MDLVVTWVVGCSLQSWAEEQGGPLKLEKCRLVKYHILGQKMCFGQTADFPFFGMVYNLLYRFFGKGCLDIYETLEIYVIYTVYIKASHKP